MPSSASLSNQDGFSQKDVRIGIISGSQRNDSQTDRIAQALQNMCDDMAINSHCLSLHEASLPMWNTDFPSGSGWGGWQKVKKELDKDDGFIFLTPEWGGMCTPTLKNFFLLGTGGELFHKPAIIGAISAARGGAYPISELRQSSYKNTGIVYIPDHLIFRNVESLFPDSTPRSSWSEEAVYMDRRCRYSIKVLAAYASQMKPLRQASNLLDRKTYPNGM